MNSDTIEILVSKDIADPRVCVVTPPPLPTILFSGRPDSAEGRPELVSEGPRVVFGGPRVCLLKALKNHGRPVVGRRRSSRVGLRCPELVWGRVVCIGVGLGKFQSLSWGSRAGLVPLRSCLPHFPRERGTELVLSFSRSAQEFG